MEIMARAPKSKLEHWFSHNKRANQTSGIQSIFTLELKLTYSSTQTLFHRWRILYKPKQQLLFFYISSIFFFFFSAFRECATNLGCASDTVRSYVNRFLKVKIVWFLKVKICQTDMFSQFSGLRRRPAPDLRRLHDDAQERRVQLRKVPGGDALQEV